MNTRTLTRTLRAIADAYRDAYKAAGYDLSVRLDRSYGRRFYALEYTSPTRIGTLITLDTNSKTLWIRRVACIDQQWYRAIVRETQTDLAANTTHLDTLMYDAHALGYTTALWGETPQTLATWREHHTD